MITRIWILPLLIALCACVNASPDSDDAAEPGATATTATVEASPAVLTMTGLGPVQIGMAVSEAEQALGAKLAPMMTEESAACWQTRRADGQGPQVFYVVEHGWISRIDIDYTTGNTPTAIKTDKGIGIGAAEADVLEAYGPATKVTPH